MHDLQELTTHCIRCGFCLEDCPTFVETSNELESPRGRIYLVRSAIEGELQWDDIKPHIDLCLGCRACETACPSGVQYGAILEMARDRLGTTITKQALLAGTTNPKLLKAQLAAAKLLPGKRLPGFFSRALSGSSAEADLPTPQALKPLPPIVTEQSVRGEVYMLTGCAMQVLYPRVHECTRRLLRRIGYVVKDVEQGCCGALHTHNGDLKTARRMGEELVDKFPGDIPIIVNSAGCGSTMKEYGDLLEFNISIPPGTMEDAQRVISEKLDQAEDHQTRVQWFVARVFDLSEFLLTHGLLDELKSAPGLGGKCVTYHDACHLSHGQKITSEPRRLIQEIPNSTFVELPESMMCCGSAGVYNVLQPKMARRLLDRKVGHIESTEADVVATGNPGCHAWIAQGCGEVNGPRVLHTAELLEAAFVGIEEFL